PRARIGSAPDYSAAPGAGAVDVAGAAAGATALSILRGRPGRRAGTAPPAVADLAAALALADAFAFAGLTALLFPAGTLAVFAAAGLALPARVFAAPAFTGFAAALLVALTLFAVFAALGAVPFAAAAFAGLVFL